tara:strand:+ start:5488 stop:5817 length:330 start_codon:yes stop_codon:yes gene_type:complete
LPTLDLINLKEFSDELISQILTIYLADGKKDIEELNKAVEDNNFSEAGKKAHKITGSSKTVGALNVAELTEQLENTLENNPHEFSNQQLIELSKAFSDVETHIKKHNLI